MIVIGGDDSYKDEDEEDSAFISRWAKRKISSQFSDELIDGTKSFIFSWNQKHRAIHEEALVHFLDERKRGKKFEYQPKGKSSQVSETAMAAKANESTREKDPREGKSTQGRDGSDATGLRTSAFGDKPKRRDTYSGPSHEKGVRDNRTPHTGKDGSFRQGGGSHPQVGTDPFQNDGYWNASSTGNTPFHTGKEGSFRRMAESDRSVGMDPQQSGAISHPSPRRSASFHGNTPSSFRESARLMNDPFAPRQSDAFRDASPSENTSLHSRNDGRFSGMIESDRSVGMGPLQSGAISCPSPRRSTSLNADTPSSLQASPSTKLNQPGQKGSIS